MSNVYVLYVLCLNLYVDFVINVGKKFYRAYVCKVHTTGLLINFLFYSTNTWHEHVPISFLKNNLVTLTSWGYLEKWIFSKVNHIICGDNSNEQNKSFIWIFFWVIISYYVTSGIKDNSFSIIYLLCKILLISL